MNFQTLIVGFSLVIIGVQIFLRHEFYAGQYHDPIVSPEGQRYFGAMIVLVGGWFLGRTWG